VNRLPDTRRRPSSPRCTGPKGRRPSMACGHQVWQRNCVLADAAGEDPQAGRHEQEVRTRSGFVKEFEHSTCEFSVSSKSRSRSKRPYRPRSTCSRPCSSRRCRKAGDGHTRSVQLESDTCRKYGAEHHAIRNPTSRRVHADGSVLRQSPPISARVEPSQDVTCQTPTSSRK